MSVPGGRLLLLVAFVLAWFGTLGLRPLYKADESRYAEVAREMVVSGDWVTPRLNGFKYFEKPPLQYWVTAVAFVALGTSDWVARLWPALAGFAVILLVYWGGNRLFAPPAGFFAAAVLAGSPLYILLGQISTLDMGVSLFISAAVFAFALAQRDEAGETDRRRWMLAFWAACALAVLSKGLIGVVLPLMAIALYVIVRRDWGLVSRLALLPGVALFLALAAPWFIAVTIVNDEFAQFFFIQEHLQRFTTNAHGREGPVWYFLPVLAFGIGPWLLPFAFAWPGAFRTRAGAKFNPHLFLALWPLLGLVFFSASGSKLPSYVLPIFPAFAVLIGRWLATGEPHRLMVAQAALVAVAGIALGALAEFLVRELGPDLPWLLARYTPWLIAAGACMLTGSLGAVALARRQRLGAAIGAHAIGVFACTQFALIGHGALAPYYSAAELIASVQPPPALQARVFAVNAYDHTLPWNLRHLVTMVGYADELAKAVEWEPHKFVPDLATFAAAWAKDGQAFAIFAVRDFESIRAQFALRAEIVARDPRYILVRKP